MSLIFNCLRQRRGDRNLFQVFRQQLLSFPQVDGRIVLTGNGGDVTNEFDFLLTLIRIMEAFTFIRPRTVVLEGILYVSFSELVVRTLGPRKEFYTVSADIMMNPYGLVRYGPGRWYACGPMSNIVNSLVEWKPSTKQMKGLIHYLNYHECGWGWKVRRVLTNRCESYEEDMRLLTKEQAAKTLRFCLTSLAPSLMQSCYQVVHAHSGKFWIVDGMTSSGIKGNAAALWLYQIGWASIPLRVRAEDAAHTVGNVALKHHYIYRTGQEDNWVNYVAADRSSFVDSCYYGRAPLYGLNTLYFEMNRIAAFVSIGYYEFEYMADVLKAHACTEYAIPHSWAFYAGVITAKGQDCNDKRELLKQIAASYDW